MAETREVIVIGAGPVGLSLALGLARDGIDVLVLEKKSRTAEHSRAPAIWCAAQEVLAELGVLDRLLDRGVPMPEVALHDADAGGRVLLRIPIRELEGQTEQPRLLVVPQSVTEQVLCEAVREAGGEIRFGTEVCGVRQDGDGVRLRVGSGAAEDEMEARFAAGCDGAQSIVRNQLGGRLEGITYEMRAALADFEIGGGDLPSPRLTTRDGLAVAMRMGPRLWRLILPFAAEADEAALERRIAGALPRLFPGREAEPVWQSEFRLHQRVSTIWSRGRIALAGDAAHLTSPVGGQGMNAGILDAAALRVALREALAGEDPAPLALYTQRRRQAVRTGVNRFTDTLTKMLMAGRGRLIRPALAAASLLLAFPPVRRRILRRFAMLDQR